MMTKPKINWRLVIGVPLIGAGIGLVGESKGRVIQIIIGFACIGLGMGIIFYD